MTLPANTDEHEPVNRINQVVLSLRTESQSPNWATIRATINFAVDRYDRGWGTIWLGLRGGEMRLAIDNGTMPLDRVELAPELPSSVEVDRTITQETSKTKAGKVIAKAEASANPSAQVSNEAMRCEAKKETISDKYRSVDNQVRFCGSDRAPKWFFKPMRGHKFLEGRMKDQKLGDVYLKKRPCNITATFHIRDDDLRFEAEEGRPLGDVKEFCIRLLFLKKLQISEPISQHTVCISS